MPADPARSQRVAGALIRTALDVTEILATMPRRAPVVRVWRRARLRPARRVRLARLRVAWGLSAARGFTGGHLAVLAQAAGVAVAGGCAVAAAVSRR